MHPSEAIHGQKTRLLAGRSIILGLSGSIAAVEAPRIARELLRHGAQVTAVMTPEAQRIITPEAMRFATGRAPITELTGDVEHIRHLGPGPGRADLLLLVPATANTISKIAHGIDDTVVTTFASVALGGGVPVLISPAMHGDMARNPLVKENVDRLVALGVGFIPPVLEEGEAKLPTPEVVAAHVLHRIGQGPWSGRHLLVIGGSSSEPIDDVRSVTNEGTGRMAVDLATQAFYRGAEVTCWMGDVRVPLPPFLTVERFRTLQDLEGLIRGGTRQISSMDAVIVPAALSDFRLEPRAGKIPSSSARLSLELQQAPKVLPQLRERLAPPRLLVGFKLESGLDPRALVTRAREVLKRTGCDALVANDRAAMGSTKAEVHLVRLQGKVHPYAGSKDQVAGRLLDDLATDLPPKG